MPTDSTGKHAIAPPTRPAGPVISVPRGQVSITGRGFLPDRQVSVRITHTGDDIRDYLTFVSDADGLLNVVLPETALIGTGQIAVTDYRHDPAGDGGLLWSNTIIVAASGT